jgi:hypothetical protein
VHCGHCGTEGVTIRSCPDCRHLPRQRVGHAGDVIARVVPPPPPEEDNIFHEIRDLDGEESGDDDGNFDEPDENDDAPNAFRAEAPHLEARGEELNGEIAQNQDNDEPGFEPIPIANGPQWDEVTVEDVPARQLRSEDQFQYFSELPEFKRKKTGPTRLVSDKRPLRPIDIFELYWTPELQDKFIKNTNWYGRRYISRWSHDLSRAEFKAFLAIILELGRIKFPNRASAFSNNGHGSPFIIVLGISLTRFNHILKAWRYEDYSDKSAEEIRRLKAADPFWPVKEMAEQLASRFRSMYQCRRGMDIDEQSVPHKGRHRCKCYNPNKPYKWHFKIFSLNDSETGYMSNFYLYAGASEVRPNGVSATEYPVRKLLNWPQYQDKHHVICTDNWYTSLAVLLFCASISCHFLGTCKTNRSGLPENGKFATNDRQPRGTIKSMRSSNVGSIRKFRGREQINIPVEGYFTAWKDNKPVHILSSFPTHKTTVMRNSEDDHGTWTRLSIAIPSIIKIYNWFMGGTDSMDQRLSYYRPNVKTHSWVPKLMIHFMNASVVNSYIVFKEYFKKPKSYSLLDFLGQLIDELAEPWILEQHQNKKTHDAVSRTIMRKQKWSNAWIRRLAGEHRAYIPHVPNVLKDGVKRNFLRGHCINCRDKLVNTKCRACGVYLCLISEDGAPTCFDFWHDNKDLMSFGGHEDVTGPPSMSI